MVRLVNGCFETVNNASDKEIACNYIHSVTNSLQG
jgi:hypothetical protein